MKTALDLPDDLVKQVKLIAVHRGKKLKDVIAELLRRGIEASAEGAPARSAMIARDVVTGLPVVVCGLPASGMSPEAIAAVLIDQEAEWVHEAS